MPSLEEALRRYGDVLDESAARSGQTVELVSAPRARHVTRAARTALVAVAVVAVVSLIAVATSERATKEPGPGTSPIVGTTTAASTTTVTPTTVDAQKAAAEAETVAGKAWISAHGGRLVGLDSVVGLALTDRAAYVLSDVNSADPAETLSRVDRTTGRIVSVQEPAAQTVTTGGTAVYLLSSPASLQWQIQRLDPDTLRPIWTVPISGSTGDGPGFTAGSGVVWVSTGNRLEQLDAQSGTVRQSRALSVDNLDTSLALDPTGRLLYVVYGDTGGGTEPIEVRGASSGARLEFNPRGAASVGAADAVATTGGVWVSYRTGMNGAASFFRARDLGQSAVVTVAGMSSFGMGVGLSVFGSTLWVANVQFLACADAVTGQAFAEPGQSGSNSLNLYAGPVAVDVRNAFVVIDGVLGVFSPHGLCPETK